MFRALRLILRLTWAHRPRGCKTRSRGEVTVSSRGFVPDDDLRPKMSVCPSMPSWNSRGALVRPASTCAFGRAVR